MSLAFTCPFYASTCSHALLVRLKLYYESHVTSAGSHPSDVDFAHLGMCRCLHQELSVISESSKIVFHTYLSVLFRICLCGDECAGASCCLMLPVST